MIGRKPVPRALKLARGNPGHRPIRDDEPQPAAVADLAVPKVLQGDADAAAAWATTAPLLHRNGLLTETDVAALVLYCQHYGRWVAAERAIRKHGMMIVTTKKGVRRFTLSPYLAIASTAADHCRKLLLEFGCTPVSRARVHAPKHEPRNQDKDRFFGGHAPGRGSA